MVCTYGPVRKSSQDQDNQLLTEFSWEIMLSNRGIAPTMTSRLIRWWLNIQSKLLVAAVIHVPCFARVFFPALQIFAHNWQVERLRISSFPCGETSFVLLYESNLNQDESQTGLAFIFPNFSTKPIHYIPMQASPHILRGTSRCSLPFMVDHKIALNFRLQRMSFLNCNINVLNEQRRIPEL